MNSGAATPGCVTGAVRAPTAMSMPVTQLQRGGTILPRMNRAGRRAVATLVAAGLAVFVAAPVGAQTDEDAAARAAAEIAAARDRAMTNVAGIAIEAASAIVARITGVQPGADEVKRAVAAAEA